MDARWSARVFRRVVIKIGSAVLTSGPHLDDAVLASIAGQIQALRQLGLQVVVVSSGAVACGLEAMGLQRRPMSIVEQQAAAAAGQSRLVEAWGRALSPFDLSTAQFLLTSEDVADRRRFLNARRTFDAVLSRGLVPIVNENDAVSFEEIKFGDNDRLSALVTQVTHADLLVLLSTVPGLMNARTVIQTVDNLAQADSFVRPDRSATGVGGMQTKLQAAGLAASWGVPVVIASGREHNILQRVVGGEPIGTLIVPAKTREASRKRWIGAGTRTKGVLVIDSGAAQALRRNASLLPAGVRQVEGTFAAGDPVEIRDPQGTLLGRGLVLYGSQDAARIAGAKSNQIAERLGFVYTPELIHRDSLALVQPSAGAPT